MSAPDIYEFTVKDIKEQPQTLSQYHGKVLLIVNTASRCGFTPQFQGLQTLYEHFGSEKFMVLGFPCNQFLHQDPESNSTIQEFCEMNYGVTFPMFGKIDVNGSQAHPLYRYLKSQAKGLLGSKSIKWNFTKFLVDAKGNVIKRYGPKVKPETLKSEIARLLET